MVNINASGSPTGSLGHHTGRYHRSRGGCRHGFDKFSSILHHGFLSGLSGMLKTLDWRLNPTVAALYERRFFPESTKYRRS